MLAVTHPAGGHVTVLTALLIIDDDLHPDIYAWLRSYPSLSGCRIYSFSIHVAVRACAEVTLQDVQCQLQRPLHQVMPQLICSLIKKR